MAFSYEKDYYGILEVNPDADSIALRKAYYRLAKKYHPDTNPNNRVFEEKFKDVNDAYEILTDPYYRVLYNEHLKNPLAYKQEPRPQSEPYHPKYPTREKEQPKSNLWIYFIIVIVIIMVRNFTCNNDSTNFPPNTPVLIDTSYIERKRIIEMLDSVVKINQDSFDSQNRKDSIWNSMHHKNKMSK